MDTNCSDTTGDSIPSADSADCADSTDSAVEPAILEEIEIEDLAVDGICGVY